MATVKQVQRSIKQNDAKMRKLTKELNDTKRKKSKLAGDLKKASASEKAKAAKKKKGKGSKKKTTKRKTKKKK